MAIAHKSNTTTTTCRRRRSRRNRCCDEEDITSLLERNKPLNKFYKAKLLIKKIVVKNNFFLSKCKFYRILWICFLSNDPICLLLPAD